jgi:hypothetical protein
MLFMSAHYCRFLLQHIGFFFLFLLDVYSCVIQIADIFDKQVIVVEHCWQTDDRADADSNESNMLLAKNSLF